MNFGLTGIGIGGLFYIGCALIILIIEGYKKLRVRYHQSPRQLVGDLSVILIGIVGATLLSDAALSAVLTYVQVSHSGTAPAFVPSTGLLEVRSIVVGIVILVVVLTLTYVVSLILNKETSQEHNS